MRNHSFPAFFFTDLNGERSTGLIDTLAIFWSLSECLAV